MLRCCKTGAQVRQHGGDHGGGRAHEQVVLAGVCVRGGMWWVGGGWVGSPWMRALFVLGCAPSCRQGVLPAARWRPPTRPRPPRHSLAPAPRVCSLTRRRAGGSQRSRAARQTTSFERLLLHCPASLLTRVSASLPAFCQSHHWHSFAAAFSPPQRGLQLFLPCSLPSLFASPSPPTHPPSP